MDPKREGPATKRRRLEDGQNLIFPRSNIDNSGPQLDQQQHSYSSTSQPTFSHELFSSSMYDSASIPKNEYPQMIASTTFPSVQTVSPWQNPCSDFMLSQRFGSGTALQWQGQQYSLQGLESSWNSAEYGSMEMLPMFPSLPNQHIPMPGFSTTLGSFGSLPDQAMICDYAGQYPPGFIDDGSSDQELAQHSPNASPLSEGMDIAKQVVCFGTVCGHIPRTLS